jgi:hypothetical protein
LSVHPEEKPRNGKPPIIQKNDSQHNVLFSRWPLVQTAFTPGAEIPRLRISTRVESVNSSS